MDMALDDVITKNKRGAGGGRGRGGFRGRGGRRGFSNGSPAVARGGGSTQMSGKREANRLMEKSNNLRRAAITLLNKNGQLHGHDHMGGTKPGRIPQGVWTRGGGLRSGMSTRLSSTTKIQIDNLEFGVSDDDIKELFGEFGAIRKSMVHYDASGRSQGSAEVVYERRADAMKAIAQYNGLPLDGRPMKIDIVGGDGGGAPFAFNGGAANPPRRARAAFSGAPTRGRGRGAPRGGGGGARGGAAAKKPTMTTEDLDKELDAYISKN